MILKSTPLSCLFEITIQIDENQLESYLLYLLGKILRPAEGYLSWCQSQPTFNLTSTIGMLHVFTLVTMISVCQVYVQCMAGISMKFGVTLKHTFVAIICILIIVLFIYFGHHFKLNVTNIIPLNTILGILAPISFNIGFLIKEHPQDPPNILPRPYPYHNLSTLNIVTCIHSK